MAIQGLGNVGYHLANELHAAGAKLIVTDIDAGRIQRVVEATGATAVPLNDIYGVKADIFAPCALGGILNDDTIPQLQVEIVAGAANNQLLEDRHGDALEARGILYAPDYVANAGGVINVYSELTGWSRERSLRKADEIYSTVLSVFRLAQGNRHSHVQGGRPGGRAAHQRRARYDQDVAAVSQPRGLNMVDVARPGERIPIASDHAGFELKERLRVALAELGYDVQDIGTHSTASTDYPDYAHPLAAGGVDGRGRARRAAVRHRARHVATSPTGIPACARPWRGRRRSPRSRASTTTRTCWCCRRASCPTKMPLPSSAPGWAPPSKAAATGRAWRRSNATPTQTEQRRMTASRRMHEGASAAWHLWDQPAAR